MRKLKNLYNIKDFKLNTEKFKENEAHISYRKVFEATDFSNKTGFSESLVGRAINTIFSKYKKNKYAAMLEDYSRAIEDEYLISVFRTLAEMGYTEENIRSEFLELYNKAIELFNESKEVEDSCSFEEKLQSGDFNFTDEEKVMLNDVNRKNAILGNLEDKTLLYTLSLAKFEAASIAFKDNKNEKFNKEARYVDKIIDVNRGGLPSTLQTLEKFKETIRSGNLNNVTSNTMSLTQLFSLSIADLAQQKDQIIISDDDQYKLARIFKAGCMINANAYYNLLMQSGATPPATNTTNAPAPATPPAPATNTAPAPATPPATNTAPAPAPATNTNTIITPPPSTNSNNNVSSGKRYKNIGDFINENTSKIKTFSEFLTEVNEDMSRSRKPREDSEEKKAAITQATDFIKNGEFDKAKTYIKQTKKHLISYDSIKDAMSGTIGKHHWDKFENYIKEEQNKRNENSSKRGIIEAMKGYIRSKDFEKAREYAEVTKKGKINYDDVKKSLKPEDADVWKDFVNYMATEKKKARKKRGLVEVAKGYIRSKDFKKAKEYVEITKKDLLTYDDIEKSFGDNEKSVWDEMQSYLDKQDGTQDDSKDGEEETKINEEKLKNYLIVLKRLLSEIDRYDKEHPDLDIDLEDLKTFYSDDSTGASKVIKNETFNKIIDGNSYTTANDNYENMRNLILSKEENIQENVEIMTEATAVPRQNIPPSPSYRRNDRGEIPEFVNDHNRKTKTEDFEIGSNKISTLLGDEEVRKAFPTLTTVFLNDDKVFKNFKKIPNGKDVATKKVNIYKLGESQLAAERLFTNKSKYLGSDTSEYSPNVRQNFIVKPADREHLESIWKRKIELIRGRYSNYLNVSVLYPEKVLELNSQLTKEYTDKLTKPEITAAHRAIGTSLTSIMEEVFDCSSNVKLTTGGTTAIINMTIDGNKQQTGANATNKNYNFGLVVEVIEMTGMKSASGGNTLTDMKGYRVKGLLDVEGIIQKYGTNHKDLVNKSDQEKISIFEQFVNTSATDAVKTEMFGNLDLATQIIVLLNKNALSPSTSYAKHSIVTTDDNTDTDFGVVRFKDKNLNNFTNYAPEGVAGKANVNYVAIESQVIQTYLSKNNAFFNVKGILNIDTTNIKKFTDKITSVVNSNTLNQYKLEGMFDPKPGKTHNKAYKDKYEQVYGPIPTPPRTNAPSSNPAPAATTNP